MRLGNLEKRAIGLGFSVAFAGAAQASTTTTAVVPGTAAIFLAGRTDVTIAPPGAAPAGYPLSRNNVPGPGPYSETFPLEYSATPRQTFQFSASGKLDLDVQYNQVYSTPDGAGYNTAVDSVAGISGYYGPEGALVGVFLNNTDPENSTPPSSLNFSTTSFLTLSPGLDQVFFIGDGLTGNGSGTTQTFYAPTGATRFFLGVVDVSASGAAGNYDDNSGQFNVSITSSSVPEPSAALGALTFLSILSARRRRNLSAAAV